MMIRRKSWASAVGAAALAAIFAAGCTSNTAGDGCQAGDQRACNCADGAHGYAQCSEGALTACQCTAPSDAGASQDAAPLDAMPDSHLHEGGVAKTDAGFGEFMGPCNVDADCPPGDMCFTFATKGPHCTRSCQTSADCPPPSVGCNPRNICAVPD